MPAPVTYPPHLIPRAAYQLLASARFAAGLLLRRCSDPEVVAADGKIRPDQLSHPTEDLARHFSVNLLGTFKLPDAAWIMAPGPARAQLLAAWQPGADGQLPAPEEAFCLSKDQWGYYWLALAELHECRFSSIGEAFTCYVCHAPTCSNYWHFELHFHTAEGDVYALDSKRRKKVAPKIRAWLQDYACTQPPLSAPPAVDWPTALYTVAQSTDPKK